MKNIFRTMLLLWVFLLPWQARLILRDGHLGMETWQYGTISLSAAEMVLGFLFLLIVFKLKPSKLLTAPAVILVSLLLLGVVRADDSLLALSRAALLIALISTVLAASSFATPTLRELSLAFLWGMLPQTILGFAQFVLQEAPAMPILGVAAHHASVLGDSVIETATGRFLRAYGSFPHPNIFGGFAAVAIIVSAWLLAQTTRRRGRALFSISLLLNSAVLFFTFSRSAWIAAVAGLVLLSVSFGWRKVAPGIISALALIMILASVAYPLVQTRVLGEGRLEARSVTERLDTIARGWQAWRVHPLLGVGMGNGTLAVAKMFPGAPLWSLQPPHNIVLAAAVELGVLGLAALVLVLVFLLRGVWRHSLARALLASVALIGFFDHYLWTIPAGLGLLGLVFILVFGCQGGLTSTDRRVY